MEVIEKDAVYIDEFFREFLAKKICSKNEFNRCAGKLHFISRFLRSTYSIMPLVVPILTKAIPCSLKDPVQPSAVRNGASPADDLRRRQPDDQIASAEQSVA